MGLGRSTTWCQRMSQLPSHNDTVTAFPPSPDWSDFSSYDLPALCRAPFNPTTTIVDIRGSPNRYSLSHSCGIADKAGGPNNKQITSHRNNQNTPQNAPDQSNLRPLGNTRRGAGFTYAQLIEPPETLLPCTSVSLFCRPEKIKSFCNQVGVVGGLGGWGG